MAKKQPKQLVNSNYERNENDAYYTDHWVTRALLTKMTPQAPLTYIDPAAGRGDILAVYKDAIPKLSVFGVDIAPPRKRFSRVPIVEGDFLQKEITTHRDSGHIVYVTNPPFGHLAQKFLRKCLADERATQVAFLLRSLWNTSPGRKNSRMALFNKSRENFGIPYAYEIVLTERPLWDWWYTSAAESAENNKPFHSYSWHVWDRNWKGPSTQFWVGNDGKGRIKL